MPQPRVHTSHAARQAAYRKRQEQARTKEQSNRGLPPLPAISTLPGHARWTGAISQAICLLTGVVSEMQDYFADRSEEWQESDRGDAHQHRTKSVREIVEALETVWT